MKTLIQIIMLFASPIVVYMSLVGHRFPKWWALIGFVAFIFGYFWAGYTSGGKEKHFFRKILLEVMITGIVSLMIWYFLK